MNFPFNPPKKIRMFFNKFEYIFLLNITSLNLLLQDWASHTLHIPYSLETHKQKITVGHPSIN